MKKYLSIAKEFIAEIPTFAIESIPRHDNQLADSLSKLAFRGTRIQEVHFLEQALCSVLENRGEVFNIHTQDNWMTSLQNFLKKGTLPEDEGEATKISRIAANYLLIDGELYRRRFSTS